MAVIGSLTIGMKVGTSAFKKGLKTSRTALQKFQSNLLSAKGAFLAFSAALGVGAPIAALKSLTSSALDSIDQISKFSDEVGFTTQDLVGFRLGAGLTGTSVETLNKGLQRFVRRMGEAKLGTGEGIKGLQALGVEADSLAQMETGDAFRLVAQKISELPGPAEKAATAYSLFGRQGQELMTFLNSGAEGINGFVKEAEDLGLAFDRVDGTQVEAANDAMLRMKTIFTSVGQQLAIQLAPMIVAVANKFTELANTCDGMAQFITNSLEMVTRAVGVVADVVHALKLGFMLLQSAVTAVISFILRDIETLAKDIEKIINLIPGVEVSFTETLSAITDDLHKLASNQFEEFKDELGKEPPSAGITKFFDDLRSESRKTAEELVSNSETMNSSLSFSDASENASNLIDRLQEQIETFGLSSNAAEIYKLKQAGASEEILNQAQSLSKQIKQMEESKKAQELMAGRAESIIEATRTPMEKFHKEVDELRELLHGGLIDENTFQRALKQMEGPLDVGGGFAGAVELGSTAARSAILRSRQAGKNPMKGVEDNTENQLAESKLQTSILKKIAGSGEVVVFEF